LFSVSAFHYSLLISAQCGRLILSASECTINIGLHIVRYVSYIVDNNDQQCCQIIVGVFRIS